MSREALLLTNQAASDCLESLDQNYAHHRCEIDVALSPYLTFTLKYGEICNSVGSMEIGPQDILMFVASFRVNRGLFFQMSST